MFEIRPVTTEDIPEITELAARCWYDYFADTSASLMQAACDARTECCVHYPQSLS